jgi:hypothetical protein
MKRWGNLLRHEIQGRTAHWVGVPTSISGRQQERLPNSKALVIEERPEGVFLFRYSAANDFAGDTWHRDIEEARSQASVEFGDELGEWVDIPDAVIDAIAYLTGGAPEQK